MWCVPTQAYTSISLTTSCSFRAELPVVVRRRVFPGDLMRRSHAKNAPASPRFRLFDGLQWRSLGLQKRTSAVGSS